MTTDHEPPGEPRQLTDAERIAAKTDLVLAVARSLNEQAAAHEAARRQPAAERNEEAA